MNASTQLTTREAILAGLSAAQEASAELTSRIEAMRVQLNQTTPFLSCLSHDIITEIFFTCVYSDCYRPTTPFELGHICRAWRSLVWTVPKLWRNIHIRFSKNESLQCELLAEWIRHSATQPLDIVIRTSTDVKHALWDPPIPLLQLLLTVSPRWQTFEADESPLLNLSAALAKGEYHFPMLSSFGTQLSGKGLQPPWPLKWPPLLRHLYLQHDIRLEKYQVNWSILERASVSLPLAEGSLFLKECEDRLSYANLKLIPHRLPLPVRSEEVVLPKLEHLTLWIAANKEWRPDVTLFLQKLTLPSLSSLHLNHVPFDMNVAQTFVDMLQRSKCQLTSIYINWWHPVPEFELLMKELSRMPLEDIEIEADNGEAGKLFTDEICSLLNPDIGGPSVSFPRLKTFEYTGDIKFTPRKLKSAIKARFRHYHDFDSSGDETEVTSATGYDTTESAAVVDEGDSKGNSQLEGTERSNKLSMLKRFEIIYDNTDWHQRRNHNWVRLLHLEFARLEERYKTRLRLRFFQVTGAANSDGSYDTDDDWD